MPPLCMLGKEIEALSLAMQDRAGGELQSAFSLRGWVVLSPIKTSELAGRDFHASGVPSLHHPRHSLIVPLVQRRSNLAQQC